MAAGLSGPRQDASSSDLGLAKEWFLSADERGNPSTEIDAQRGPGAWSFDNAVVPLVHGADYFRRLATRVAALREGDELFLADWRGDEDQLLSSDGPALGVMLADAARRGVRVRGLLWRSHPQWLGFNQQEQGELARIVNEAGARSSWTSGYDVAGHTTRSSFVDPDGRPGRLRRSRGF
jgi:hypothetical protein